jgi:hypothetical protein
MRLARWAHRIQWYWQFQPLKFHFILFLFIYWGIRYTVQQSKLDTSSYIGLILLMAKIVLVFAVVVTLFCLLTVFVSYLFFIAHRKSVAQPVELSVRLDSKSARNATLITKMPMVLRPFLGYVKLRLSYDDFQLTDSIVIGRKKKGHWFFFQSGLESENEIWLPDIREYHFQRALVSFEDFLHLFRFTATVPMNQPIRNHPKLKSKTDTEVLPKKTVEEKVRIEQLRKVEGEYLNYKKFENSDDVRRIVWKIFAKNKELVVRIPEIMDPFSSHIYFYASFHTTAPLDLFGPYHQAMLNNYKHWIYTLYTKLQHKDFEVRYIQDQVQQQNEATAIEDIITLAQWHKDKTLLQFVKPQQASVVCIHSFTSYAEVQELLEMLDSQTMVYFIPLGKSLRSLYLLNWISRIFLRPNRDPLVKLKNKWPFHPLRFTVLDAEKKMKQLLQSSSVNFEIIE